MTYYRFPENKWTKALFGAFLLAMLFLARDSMITTAVLGLTKSQFLVLGMIVLVGMAFLFVNFKHWKQLAKDGRLLLLLVLTLVMLFPMALKRDWQMMYFSVLIGIWFSVFLSFFTTTREVARYYVWFLTVLGLYSVLATYLLRIPIDRGLMAMPVFKNASGHTFHNFFFAIVSDSFVKNRNFGIFREPGVYQYFILLAMLLNNYVVVWQKPSHQWLINGALAVTMLSTFATGGVAEMGLLAIVIFFDKELYKDKRVVIAVAVMAVLSAAALAVIIAQRGELYFELYSMVIDKFTPGAESGSDRLMSILTDGKIFLENPLMGDDFATVLYAVPNNTSSTMILYAVYGVLGGTLSVGAWVALLWSRERKAWVNLALIVIAFLSFNTQNLTTDVFFWLFPILALTEYAVPKLTKRSVEHGT